MLPGGSGSGKACRREQGRIQLERIGRGNSEREKGMGLIWRRRILEKKKSRERMGDGNINERKERGKQNRDSESQKERREICKRSQTTLFETTFPRCKRRPYSEIHQKLFSLKSVTHEIAQPLTRQ